MPADRSIPEGGPAGPSTERREAPGGAATRPHTSSGTPGALRARPAAGGAPASPSAGALSAAREHAVLAATLDPIVTIDACGSIQSASDSVRRVFGWTPDELVGRNVNILMAEPQHSAHDGYLADYRRSGESHIIGRTREFEQGGVRRNGERFPVEVSISRVDPPDGGLPLFVGIIRDVTARKRLERELRLIKDLALSISAAASLHDALVDALRQMCLATEWDYGEVWMPSPEGDELVGAALWARPASGLEAFATTMPTIRFRRGAGLPGRAWSSGLPEWIGDVTTLRDADFCRPVAARKAGLRGVTAVPILSADEVIAVLLFFVRATRPEDVHLLELVKTAAAPLGALIQRKRAEDERDEQRDHLEEMVAERSAALQTSQDRLRMADRLASIGALAAGLGHDMNNVLLPVRARLNALKSSAHAGDLPRKDRDHVEEIRKSIAYLQQLADGLHFLALDPDTDEDSRGGGALTDIGQWWSQAGPLISKAVPKHVRVAASIPPGLPPVTIAAHRLTQVVLNLVVNAGEAIAAPAPRKCRRGLVRLRAEAVQDADGAWVRLNVSDNGAGMTEEVMRRAFDMFFTTKPRGLGTGLGLALVRKLVDGAGGRVEIDSELGKGTTVALITPALAPPVEAGATRAGAFATITIADGRAAALIRHVLEASGASVLADGDPALAHIWVADPAATDLAGVVRWRAGRPAGRLVLFGSPDSDAPPQWLAMQPEVIDNTDDFEAIRALLGRVIASA